MEEKTGQFVESYKIRKKVLAFLKRYEWVILISLTVISWVTGYIGFWIYFREIGEVRSMADIAYVTFQLFTFESGFIDGHAPLILDFARFLAPFTLAFAAFIAFMWIIEQKYKLIKLFWFKDHTVIIGLGKSGMQLLKNMQKKDEKVVVVTRKELTPADKPENKNTVFIVKNIKDDGVLDQLRVEYAKYVMCMADDEKENLSTGNFVIDFLKIPKNKTKVFIETSPYLIEQLRDLDFDDKASNNRKIFGHKVHYFSIYDRAARLIALEYSPDDDIDNFDDFNKDSKIQAHILIAGFESLGQALLLQAGRLFHFANRNKLKASVIYTNIDEVERFNKTYPGAKEVIDLNFIALDEVNKRNIGIKTKFSKIHKVYICVANETVAIEAYNKLSLLIPETKLVFCHENPDDISVTFERKNVTHFKLNDNALTIDAIVKEKNDIKAEDAHEYYQDKKREEKKKQEGSVTQEEWKKLPELTKNSNRNQDDHFNIKLRAAGIIDPKEYIEVVKSEKNNKPANAINDRNLKDLEGTTDMVELLAEMEHRRWNADQLLSGWIFGGKKIEIERIHPDIRPYSKLSEGSKSYDRNTINKIFTLLNKD
jgi:hypothetical protein